MTDPNQKRKSKKNKDKRNKELNGKFSSKHIRRQEEIKSKNK